MQEFVPDCTDFALHTLEIRAGRMSECGCPPVDLPPLGWSVDAQQIWIFENFYQNAKQNTMPKNLFSNLKKYYGNLKFVPFSQQFFHICACRSGTRPLHGVGPARQHCVSQIWRQTRWHLLHSRAAHIAFCGGKRAGEGLSDIQFWGLCEKSKKKIKKWQKKKCQKRQEEIQNLY